MLVVKDTAFTTLAIFGPDNDELLGLLLRLALSDNSPSSAAVLQSALALSSLHLYGPQANALQLKGHALRTLITSGKRQIKTSEIVQHIAAGMILCHYEVIRVPPTVKFYVTTNQTSRCSICLKHQHSGSVSDRLNSFIDSPTFRKCSITSKVARSCHQ